MLDLLLRVLVGAIIAFVVYYVCTALVTFSHSALIFGLVALVIFLVVVFRGPALTRGGTRGGRL